jgi:hypothetical protein
MHYFGFLFIISTTLVMLFKRETNTEDYETMLKRTDEKPKINYEDKLSVVSTYKLMWKIIWIPPVKKLLIILLTMKVFIFLLRFLKRECKNCFILYIRLALLRNQ